MPTVFQRIAFRFELNAKARAIKTIMPRTPRITECMETPSLGCIVRLVSCAKAMNGSKKKKKRNPSDFFMEESFFLPLRDFVPEFGSEFIVFIGHSLFELFVKVLELFIFEGGRFLNNIGHEVLHFELGF